MKALPTLEASGRTRSAAGGGILFDLAATQPLSGEYHGAGEYARAVFRRLLELKGPEPLAAVYDSARPLAPDLAEACAGSGVELLAVSSSAAVPSMLAQRRFRRFFSALPYEYHGMDPSGARVIMTIHGLRPLEVPTDDYETRYAAAAAQQAKVLAKRLFTTRYVAARRREFQRLIAAAGARALIIVPSRHTKYMLSSQFPELDPGRILVLYSPRRIVASPAPAAETLGRLGVSPRGYFLLISGNRWIKNAWRALEALDGLYSRHPDVRIRSVVVGVTDPEAVRRRLRNVERFVLDGYVPEPELQCLYREAHALVFPSLNEGFGYPPLEAMSFGTPVACSAAASLPEICGEAPVYFDPRSVEEIQSRLLYLALERGAWERHSTLGRARAQEMAALQDSMLDELCGLILDA